MTSPESRDDSFRNALLHSAADDGPAPGALDRELARLGLATVAGTAALTAASGATAKVGAASLFSTTLAKVTIVATIAVIGATGYVATKDSTPVSALRTTTSPATTPTAATTATSPLTVAAPAVTAPEPAAPAPEPGVTTPHVTASHVTASHVAPPHVEERRRTLAAEVALIDRARTLARSSPGESMTALDEYARTFPRGALHDEAAVVRVEALLAAGRRADAERAAQPYLRDRPNTPIARRMTDLLGSKKDPIP